MTKIKTRTWKKAFRPSWRTNAGLFCSDNLLTSLEGAPSHVDGIFYCCRNLLTSLKGAPTQVQGPFYVDENKLASLEGAPSHVGGNFTCSHNQLTSLKDIHLQIKHIGGSAYFDNNPIKSHVLGLLLIDGLKSVNMDNEQVERIIDSHLPSKGMESVLLAQEELILVGLEEYAQL